MTMALSDEVTGLITRCQVWMWGACGAGQNGDKQYESGQGTTEYAILVGVLVVIAILAIMVFRPKLQELWNAIAEGINGL